MRDDYMTPEIKENISLAPYTIYKIGGLARFYTEAHSAEELASALLFARQKGLKFFILGAGSNMLICDEGFDGMAIRMAGNTIRVQGERIELNAGVMMARGVAESARAGLTGFEWGIGVPGTVGGSVRGNAGCFGGEMRHVVESVDVFDAGTGETKTISAVECRFGYRDSVFKKHAQWIILAATLRLHAGDSPTILHEIKRMTAERITKQDIGTKSCGCIFKNVAWETLGGARKEWTARLPILARFSAASHIPASFLIDEAGLKGQCYRAVCISPKHANFFVNEGGAEARDVKVLIERAKRAVKEKFAIALEEEIQYIG